MGATSIKKNEKVVVALWSSIEFAHYMKLIYIQARRWISLLLSLDIKNGMVVKAAKV